MVLKIRLSCLIFILCISGLSAQNFPCGLNTAPEIMQQSEMYSLNENRFPSIRPYYFKDLFLNDSSVNLKTEFFSLLSFENHEYKFMTRVEPVLEAGFMNQKFTPSVLTKVTTFSEWKHFYLTATTCVGSLSQLQSDSSYIRRFSVFPEYGVVQNRSSGADFVFVPTFRLNRNFTKYFLAEFGFDKHFFGHGMRSLILSDNHYPYSYFSLSAQVWKFKYVSLFGWLNDMYYPGARHWKEGISKFLAFHYLSWNVTKRFNLSLFESAVVPLHDSLMPRQFIEYNYLLPVVVYRPLDFANGSNDNILAGAEMSFKINSRNIFYTQLVFDEMFVNEIRADILYNLQIGDTARNHGAWVNKQAYQFGFKAFDVFTVRNLDFLTEYNLIRPYTYSHRDVMQNYSHLNQPLAHPLGANLKEWYTQLSYTSEKWHFRTACIYVILGLDSAGTNFGNDIFQVTFDAKIPELGNTPVKYYGNEIGQGVRTTIVYIDFSVSRNIMPKYNIYAEMGIKHKVTQSETIGKHEESFVFCSLKWGLGKYRSDY